MRPVDDYPSRLLDTLQYLAPGHTSPTVVVLTPASITRPTSSTPFWPSRWGWNSSKGGIWSSPMAWCRYALPGGSSAWTSSIGASTTRFSIRRSSVPTRSWGPRAHGGLPAGRVALANAPGTGMADDKVLYAYVPQMITTTWGKTCPAQRADLHVLGRHPAAPRPGQPGQARDQGRQRVGRVRDARRSACLGAGTGGLCPAHQANPRNYMAQPTLALSRRR